jgi:pyruvate dehydrogenase E1 component beta subunit
MVGVALEAAQQLADLGINAEVVDPRTLFPLDTETLVTSVKKTGYAIIIDEGVQRYGATGEIAATLQEHAFDYLDGPVLRIGAADVPVPFSPPLELPTIPDATRVVEAVQSLRVR